MQLYFWSDRFVYDIKRSSDGKLIEQINNVVVRKFKKDEYENLDDTHLWTIVELSDDDIEILKEHFNSSHPAPHIQFQAFLICLLKEITFLN